MPWFSFISFFVFIMIIPTLWSPKLFFTPNLILCVWITPSGRKVTQAEEREKNR